MTSLFDELVAGGPSAVRALEGRHETLELDFKGRAPAGKAGAKNDQATLGKALSAFANSMGGLLVWGVDCRKDDDGVDQVIGFTPIEGLAKFASDMREWTVSTVMPRLADVRVHALDEGGDSGFLLIDVPRSERRPHRCEVAGDKQYYRRAGASSRQMEVYEIEDAYRRTSVPELSIEYHIESGGATITRACVTARLAIMIALRNTSRVSARHVYVATSLSAPNPHEQMLRIHGISARDQHPLRYYEIDPGIIHPGVVRLIAPLQMHAILYEQGDHWFLSSSSLRQLTARFDVDFGCLDTPMRRASIAPTPQEIIGSFALDLPCEIGD